MNLLKIKNYKLKIKSGISLIEILVVVTVFAILGIIITTSLALSIGGSKKSESLVNVRENLNYSLGIVERQLRNADSVVECPNLDPKVISYKDQFGNISTFSCIGLGGTDSYLASGSARLTSSNVILTFCSFNCIQDASQLNPPQITVSLTGKDSASTGVQGSTITTSSQINLRNY